MQSVRPSQWNCPYIKDSGHLISLLESTIIPKNCTLVTIDVKSLYLNIPHKDGIDAILNRLYSTSKLADEITLPSETMTDLLGIVLKQNYFQFADKMYHQIQKISTYNPISPSAPLLFKSIIIMFSNDTNLNLQKQ